MKRIFLISLLLFLQNIIGIFAIYGLYQEAKVEYKIFQMPMPSIAPGVPLLTTPIIVQMPKIAEVKTHISQTTVPQTKSSVTISGQSYQTPLSKTVQNEVLTSNVTESKAEETKTKVEQIEKQEEKPIPGPALPKPQPRFDFATRSVSEFGKSKISFIVKSSPEISDTTRVISEIISNELQKLARERNSLGDTKFSNDSNFLCGDKDASGQKVHIEEIDFRRFGNDINTQLINRNSNLYLALDRIEAKNENIEVDFSLRPRIEIQPDATFLNEKVETSSQISVSAQRQPRISFDHEVNEAMSKFADICDNYYPEEVDGKQRLLDARDPKNELQIKLKIDNASNEDFLKMPVAIIKHPYGQARYAQIKKENENNFVKSLKIEQFLKDPSQYKKHAGYKEKIQQIVKIENQADLEKLISNLNREDIIDNYEIISQSNNFKVIRKLDDRIIEIYKHDPAHYSWGNTVSWFLTADREMSQEYTKKCEALYDKIKDLRRSAKNLCNFFKQYQEKQNHSINEEKAFLSQIKKLQTDNTLEKYFLYLADKKLDSAELANETIRILSDEGLEKEIIEQISGYLTDYISKKNHTEAEEKEFLIITNEISKDENLECYLNTRFKDQWPFIQKEVSRLQTFHLTSLGFSPEAIKFVERKVLDPINFIKPLKDPVQIALQRKIINFFNELAKNTTKNPTLQSLIELGALLANGAAELNCEGQSKETKTCLLSAQGLLDFSKGFPMGLCNSAKTSIDILQHPYETLIHFVQVAGWLSALFNEIHYLQEHIFLDATAKLAFDYDLGLTRPLIEKIKTIVQVSTKLNKTLNNASAYELGEMTGQAVGDFIVQPRIFKLLKPSTIKVLNKILNAAERENVLHRIDSFKINRWLELSDAKKLKYARKMPHTAMIVQALNIVHDQQLAAKMANQARTAFDIFCKEKNLIGHMDPLISPQQMEKRIKDLCYMFNDPMHIYEEACELKKIASQFGGKEIQLKFKNVTNELHNQAVKFNKSLDHPLIADIAEAFDKKILRFEACHCPNIDKLKASGLVNIEILEKLGSNVANARITVGGISRTKTIGLWTKEEYINRVIESLGNIQHFRKIPKGPERTIIKLWGYDKKGILFETMVEKGKIKSCYPCSSTLEEILKQELKK